MRYATASERDLIDWAVEELELREADHDRPIADRIKRIELRAKAIGATVSQANMLCRDAQAFLRRKGVKA